MNEEVPGILNEQPYIGTGMCGFIRNLSGIELQWSVHKFPPF